MKKIKLASVLFILLCFTLAPLQSQEIIIKEDVFLGMMFSTDNGDTFHNVGYGNTKLKKAFSTNSESLQHYNKFKRIKPLSMGFAIAGGLLIGWPLGTYLGSNVWTSTETILLSAGLGIAITGLIIDALANRNLKQAAKIYNNSSRASLQFNIFVAHGAHKYNGAMVQYSF
ncbi:MAG: hypothetical protein ABUK01_14440 [Leptospirales bacterium]